MGYYTVKHRKYQNHHPPGRSGQCRRRPGLLLRSRRIVSLRKPSKEAVTQFIKFSVIGASNTLVNMAVYAIVVFLAPALYLLGNVLGWALGVLNSYFWNNRYVFKDAQGKTLAKLGKMYASYAAGLALSTLLLYIYVDILGIQELIAYLLTIVFTVPVNFLLNKFWAFK
jgi:putative flippase GtrA